MKGCSGQIPEWAPLDRFSRSFSAPPSAPRSLTWLTSHPCPAASVGGCLQESPLFFVPQNCLVWTGGLCVACLFEWVGGKGEQITFGLCFSPDLASLAGCLLAKWKSTCLFQLLPLHQIFQTAYIKFLGSCIRENSMTSKLYLSPFLRPGPTHAFS